MYYVATTLKSIYIWYRILTYAGRIADVDVRWNTIAQSVDDRTPAERALVPENELEAHANQQMAGQGIRRIPKSRYDSVSVYV